MHIVDGKSLFEYKDFFPPEIYQFRVNMVMFEKCFFSIRKCSSWHVECSFENLANYFLLNGRRCSAERLTIFKKFPQTDVLKIISWTRTMQFWQPYLQFFGWESEYFSLKTRKTSKNYNFSKKILFPKIFRWTLRMQFDNPAKFFAQSPKKILNYFFSTKCFTKVFFLTVRIEFWDYPFFFQNST